MYLRRLSAISVLASVLAAGSASSAWADFVAPQPPREAPSSAALRFAALAHELPQFSVDATGAPLEDANPIRETSGVEVRYPRSRVFGDMPSMDDAYSSGNPESAGELVASLLSPPPGSRGGPPGPRGGGREPGTLGGFGSLTPITTAPGFGQPAIPNFPVQPLPAPGSALLGVLGVAAAAIGRRRA